MNRPTILNTFIAATLVHTATMATAAVHAVAVPSAKIEQLFKDTRPKTETKAGRKYADQFLKAIEPTLLRAMGTCIGKTPETITPGSFLFVIGADGRVKQLLFSKEEPLAQCVAEKLEAITTLPKPPEDNWMEGTLLANHERNEPHGKNAPTDAPMRLGTDDVTRYQKAIAPYVAKARATYPDAKRRFIAGLPKGYEFLVGLSLFDDQGHREDCLINVEKITGGKITGRIDRVDALKNYKRDQEITFSEAKVGNWLFVRPDGSEEGNYVGKFLDTYHP